MQVSKANVNSKISRFQDFIFETAQVPHIWETSNAKGNPSDDSSVNASADANTNSNADVNAVAYMYVNSKANCLYIFLT